MGGRALFSLWLGSRACLSTARGTLYDVLGVSPSSTRQEIKSQFYKLSLLYHPDRADAEDKDAASQAWRLKRFIQIANAYEILSHGLRRRAYDRQHGIQAVSQTVSTASRPVWDPYPGYRHSSPRFAYARHPAATADGTTPADPRANQHSKWLGPSEADLQRIAAVRQSSAQEQRRTATTRRRRLAAILFVITCYYFIQHYEYSHDGRL